MECQKENMQKGKSICGEDRYIRNSMEDSFAKVAEEWFDAMKPSLKPASISRYRNELNNQLLLEFGDKKAVDISRDEVIAFSGRLLTSGGRSGKRLSPKTVSGILSVMKNVMDYARNIKCIPVMTFDGISIRQSQRQPRVFSREEQKKLSDYLMIDITPIKLGIFLCLYTGLRIGEICALTWGDISFTERQIHITKTMQRIQLLESDGQKTKVIIDTPKSECSVRYIPIPEEVFRIVLEMRMPDDCFVLTGVEKGFIEPRNLENHFNAIMHACGIKNATMHTCRHSFATRCVELGFDIKTLSEILGHASVSITMNRYVHPSMDLKRKDMEKLSDLLSSR